MIYRKIFPTTRHSIHVWEPVRKATLNGPKVFGYFWAPKVTKKIDDIYFSHTVGYPFCNPIFLQRFLPFQGFPTNKHSYFRRKSFSLRLISLAEKWKECRCPVRWDWPWNAFKKFSILEE